MSLIFKDLIKKINSGRTFVLVGAGASIESGYLSWKLLALAVREKLVSDSLISAGKLDILDDFLRGNELIEFFTKIESYVGREKLIEYVVGIFSNTKLKENEIYKHICDWPFSVYLTTNYDDEIKKYLKIKGHTYISRGIKKEDLLSLRGDTQNCIYKLHGDINDPNSIIITKNDYDRILFNPEYELWREKVKTILHMFNVVVIGYSAKDPDFRQELENAKRIADENNPVYMFASDISPDEISKLLFENNIRVIKYDNKDGLHSGLKRLLRNYSSFICKRNSQYLNQPEVDPEEAEIASSVFFLNHMLSGKGKNSNKALSNVVLNILNVIGAPMSHDELNKKIKERKINVEEDEYNELIESLTESKLIGKEKNGELKISINGIKLIAESRQRNKEIKEMFREYCFDYFEQLDIKGSVAEEVYTHLEKSLVYAFRKRGMEIAKYVNSDSPIELYTSFDLVEEIEKMATKLEVNEHSAFTDIFLEILQRPTKPVRDFLAILCNGYFTYHMLNYDRKNRLSKHNDLISRPLYVDSSIIIPFFAKGCPNNSYAMSLITQLFSQKIELRVTNNLLLEVIEHADWAFRNFRNNQVGDLKTLEIVLGLNYKQNLFIDGAINWSNGRGTVTFGDYLEDILDIREFGDISKNIVAHLLDNNFQIIDMGQINGFTAEKYAEYEEMFKSIKKKRIDRTTYRSDIQCETEAELVVISKLIPISFLTHTNNLKVVTGRAEIIHWSPEILYRYLSLNEDYDDLPTLYTCMLEDFYSSGFVVNERELLDKFASPFFSQARLSLEKQNEDFKGLIEKKYDEQQLRIHENDFSLPFYTIQRSNRLVSELKNEQKRMQAELAESKKSKKLNEKEKVEYERFKNRQARKRKKNELRKKR